MTIAPELEGALEVIVEAAATRRLRESRPFRR